MASKASIKTFSTITRPIRRRVYPIQSLKTLSASKCRTFSTSSSVLQEQRDQSSPEDRPWLRTPPAMVAPVKLRATRHEFKVNTSQFELDRVYNELLGPGGSTMLSHEVKWLAVTHKSFDHGRRGFNDRLAYLGRRIIELHTTLAIVNSPPSSLRLAQPAAAEGTAERTPFKHPALEGLNNLNIFSVEGALKSSRIVPIVHKHGLHKVLRWKPRNPEKLRASGSDTVLTEALYAIIGAVSLSQGGEVAARIVRERILKPVGFLV